MPIDVLMPALSPTMTEGKLAKWLKKEGDSVTSGEVIAEIETDKATMEIEAIEEGTLGKILVAEDTEEVAINTVIAIILEEGETQDALKNYQPKSLNLSKAKTPSTPSKATPQPAASKPPPSDEDKYFDKTVILTVREALRDAMAEEMQADETVFLMGEEVAEYQGAYKVSQGLLEQFGPKRVIDTPITEHAFTGLGIGAAFGGLKPIIEFMTFNFSLQAADQLINSAAKTLYMSGGQMGCPIVFRGPNGAAARVGAQHSQCFASWYAHIPGLKVVAPYSAADAKGLLKSAIRDPNPVIFLENEILYGQSFQVPTDPEFTVPIGRAKILRTGTDITLTAFSIMSGKALEAAEQLEKLGISAEVIDLRTLRPLDTHTIIESVKKTGRLINVEEGFPFAGIGAEISALVMEQAFDSLKAPVGRITAKDVPLPYAENLEKMALPQIEDIIEMVQKTVAKNVSRQSFFASPLAQRIADQRQIDLSTITGSGARGRIMKNDLQQKQVPDVKQTLDLLGIKYTAASNSTLRKTIARRLTEAKQTIPHFYLTVDCALDALLDFRKTLNKGAEKKDKISVNDCVIKACALALKDVPAANAAWTELETLSFETADISVAVATPNGLVTPIVTQAENKSLKDIALETKDLAARARDGKLKPQEFQGGSFSLSNLGMYGITQFDAIVNPPQGCIMAIGTGTKRPIVTEDGKISTATLMTCTLSVDHRVVDGAVGAEFLAAFKGYVENPEGL